MAVRELPFVRAPALVSPDGRYIASVDPGRGVAIMKIDGTVVGAASIGSGRAQWLSDSSGLFVETSAPQRAGPLAVVELDGRTTATQLEMATPMLSRDARAIIAEHQEGCCVSISTHELWVSPRGGGPARVLARTTTTDQAQPLALLAVDSANRAVYRDGSALKVVPIDGGISQILPSAGVDVPGLTVMGTSPSGSVVMMSGTTMNSRVLLLGNRVALWGPDDGDPIVIPAAARQPAIGVPIWRTEAEVLVRTGEGRIAYRNLANGMVTVLPAKLPANANVLAYRDGFLLWSDGKWIHILDLETGTDRETASIDPASGVTGAATENHRFVLLTATDAYLLH